MVGRETVHFSQARNLLVLIECGVAKSFGMQEV